MNDSTLIKIIDLSFDLTSPKIEVETDWVTLIAIVVIIAAGILIKRILRYRNFPVVELEMEISGTPKAVFKAKRDDSNLYIANRIYIELVTRKAALPIDEENDVIAEIYDSWYILFKIIREEVKNVPGHYLRAHNSTTALIGLTTKILNEGLRPHLTEYQAKFRKWYSEENQKKSSLGQTPQKIQQRYPSYEKLIIDMKAVNQILINYSNELKKLIEGN